MADRLCASRSPRLRIVAFLAVALAVLAAGCSSTPRAEPSPSVSASSTVSPTAPGESETVPVYYLTDTPQGQRLAREFQLSPVMDDRAVAAVSAMLSSPAADPDYSSPWNPATSVKSVVATTELITVDLSEEARSASLGSATAELAVQQLVYTATAALQQSVPVLLLIAGQPAGELWGHVVWNEPISRAPALDVRLLVQINDPTEGASVPASFTVTGEAATFEAVLPWQILDATGAIVQQGSAMTAEGQTLSPFEFRIDFTGPSGTYTLLVAQDDPSGGAGGGVMSDDKVITIG